MPIYDYQCAECGHRFELRQGFDAEPVEVCPRCQGQARRRFHSVAVIYKGSGFYTTDYAHKNVSVPAKSSDEPSTGSTPSTKGTSTSSAPASTSTSSAATSASGDSTHHHKEA